MADRSRDYGAPPTDAGRDTTYDRGLRQHMLAVYNMMGAGVLLSGIIALLFSYTSLRSAVVTVAPSGGLRLTILSMIVPLATLGIVLWMNWGFNRISEGTAKVLYWVYAALVGLTIAPLLMVYTAGSAATAFFATAAGFGALSLYGYTTKRDLTAFGSFLIIGLVGLIVAMIINIFLQSSVMAMAIAAIGVLIFAGLTAYDTQYIKSIYFQARGTSDYGKIVVMSALKLYLDFVNMFIFILQLFGSRR